MALDTWTIADADDVWNFRVEVIGDPHGMNPAEHADVYNAELMQRIGDADPNMTAEDTEKAVDWARRAVAAWENGDWAFAIIVVTPEYKASGAVFTGSTETLSGIDYGWLPGATADAKGTWTTDHAYMRESWIDEMISVARDNANKELAGAKQD